MQSLTNFHPFLLKFHRHAAYSSIAIGDDLSRTFSRRSVNYQAYADSGCLIVKGLNLSSAHAEETSAVTTSNIIRNTDTIFFIGISSFLFVYLYRHIFLHFYLHFSKFFYFICFTLSATLRICSSLSPSIIIERTYCFRS